MDQKNAAQGRGPTLEDQLRSMLLSNVHVATGDPRAPQYPRPPRDYVPPHERRQTSMGYQGYSPRPPQRWYGNNTAPHEPAQASVHYGHAGVSQQTANLPQNTPIHSRHVQHNNEPASPSRSGPSVRVQANGRATVSGQEASVKAPRILQRPAPQLPPSSQAPRGPRQGTGSHVTASQQKQVPFQSAQDALAAQCTFLDQIVAQELPRVSMPFEEYSQKEAFRDALERLCHDMVVNEQRLDPASFRLTSFGSLASGFATRGSDMDLAAITSIQNTALPRLLEKKFLDAGYGARCLTRTRVPILKVCERPTAKLYAALCTEHQKWEDLPPELRDKTPEAIKQMRYANDTGAADAQPDGLTSGEEASQFGPGSADPAVSTDVKPVNSADTTALEEEECDKAPFPALRLPRWLQQENAKPWIRERKLGPLDFPKDGIGIQCDINFGNPLGLHNTALLRCYSVCDERVRPMVLFVKGWAKHRKINSPYNGTLSSYGYVLMVLHYLANIAYPPVVPNLQLAWKPPQQGSWTSMLQQEGLCQGYNIRFWRNEDQIRDLAAKKMLTHNHWPLSRLLRDFFAYYAQTGMYIPGGGFSWKEDVLSLRTPGGLRSKQEKGWTGAKTEVTDTKEVRHRYLFAIEDPFEVDHNVARTVTHNGIVAIRDEFRRAWRILGQVGRGQAPEGELFAPVVEKMEAADGQQQQIDIERGEKATGPLGEASARMQAQSNMALAGQPGPNLEEIENGEKALDSATGEAQLHCLTSVRLPSVFPLGLV